MVSASRHSSQPRSVKDHNAVLASRPEFTSWIDSLRQPTVLDGTYVRGEALPKRSALHPSGPLLVPALLPRAGHSMRAVLDPSIGCHFHQLSDWPECSRPQPVLPLFVEPSEASRERRDLSIAAALLRCSGPPQPECCRTPLTNRDRCAVRVEARLWRVLPLRPEAESCLGSSRDQCRYQRFPPPPETDRLRRARIGLEFHVEACSPGSRPRCSGRRTDRRTSWSSSQTTMAGTMPGATVTR